MAHGRGSRPLACKQCGARRADGVVISFRALCEDCAIANVITAAKLKQNRDPEYLARWQAGMRRAAESI